MTDSAAFDIDMRAFCDDVLREYEEVIETIIERPASRSAAAEPRHDARSVSADGSRAYDPA